MSDGTKSEQKPIKPSEILNDTDRLDIHRSRFTYAWNWFDFHATQRTTVVNYFILISAAILAGYSAELKISHAISVCFAGIGIAVSVLFFFLERRNHQLVDFGEQVLRDLEKNFLFRQGLAEIDASAGDNSEPKGILLREEYLLENPTNLSESKRIYSSKKKWRYRVTTDDDRGKWWYSSTSWISFPLQHSFWLPFFICVIGFLFLVCFFLTLFNVVR